MGGGRISVDVVVYSSFFSFTEYGAVDCVVGAECGIMLCPCYPAEACVEVCDFGFAIVVVGMGNS
jgi:hypothetical protein